MDNILIILKLSSPKFFSTVISFWSINFINANWAVIRKIKGKISKITEGIFKKVKKIGRVIETCKSLKKFTSSKIFKIKAKDKNTINVFSNVKENTLLK